MSIQCKKYMPKKAYFANILLCHLEWGHLVACMSRLTSESNWILNSASRLCKSRCQLIPFGITN